VTVSCRVMPREIAIHVHNDGVIPRDVQLQIFQRSFSTRPGEGRGIGTYSVRLLVERYLGGRVGFISEPEIGTRFTVTLPRPTLEEIAD
jgi:signal transduction histidine kinase